MRKRFQAKIIEKFRQKEADAVSFADSIAYWQRHTISAARNVMRTVI